MEAIGLVVWLVIGGIVGWTATFLIPSGLGLFSNIRAGIIGGFLFNQVGSNGLTRFNIWSIFVAFMGSVVFLATIRLFHSRAKTYLSRLTKREVNLQS